MLRMNEQDTADDPPQPNCGYDERCGQETASAEKNKRKLHHEYSPLSPTKFRQPRRDRNRVDSGYEPSPSSATDSFEFNFEGRTLVQHTDESHLEYLHPSIHVTPPGCAFSISHQTGEPDQFNIDIDDIPTSSASHDCLIHRVDHESAANRECSESMNRDRGGRICSLPIPIPIPDDSSKLDSQPVFCHSNSMNLGAVNVPAMASTAPTTSSPPVKFSSILNPLSWPTFRTFIASSSPLLRVSSACGTPDSLSTSSSRQTKLIDCEESSGLASDDDENVEDVFDSHEFVIGSPLEIADSNSEEVFCADDFYQLSPESLPMSSPLSCWNNRNRSNNVRRCRSVSVSLPVERDLDQVCQDIGQTLRRLSDQFSNQLNVRRSSPRMRSNTISGFIHRSPTKGKNEKDGQDSSPDENSNPDWKEPENNESQSSS